MDLRAMYDNIMELQREISAAVKEDSLEKAADHRGPDYRLVHALDGAYALQDYLADRIAQAVAAGDLEPDMEG